MTELKFDVIESVEETRLQIDFVLAEIDDEQAILNEASRTYGADRDNRVNRANLASFRTNGVLWAVAEALDIYTYKSPRLSISSGTVGILAGIAPSVFSAYAVHSSGGRHYSRQSYPNILSKFYDFPTLPRIDFPDIVWQYFNSCPYEETKSRRELMKEHWYQDKKYPYL